MVGFEPTSICSDNQGNTIIAATNDVTYFKKLSITGSNITLTYTPTFPSVRSRVTNMLVAANGHIYIAYNTQKYNGFPGETGIYKFDNSGTLWHKGFVPNVNDDGGARVLLGELDSVVYLLGNYSGTIDITGNGAYQVDGSVFLAKYDLNGNYGWSETIATGNASLNDAAYYSNSIFTGGNFQNTSDFDPTSVTYNLNSAGISDAFLAKYNGSQSPNGISKSITDELFSIYPNPATNQLFIQTNGTAISEVNIYNTTGSLVSQTKQPQTKSIDISQLANGVYIAEVKTKEASVMRRWVKM